MKLRKKMNPVEIIKTLKSEKLLDLDGTPMNIEFYEGLSEHEIDQLEVEHSLTLQTEVRELLTESSGMRNCGDVICEFAFDGLKSFQFSECFPNSLPIAHDGCGNFWVLDLCADIAWSGRIYLISHDPAVVLYQSHSLADFLMDFFKSYQSPHINLIEHTTSNFLLQVWKENPDILDYETCLFSKDDKLISFAQSLDKEFTFIDLREPQPGLGFSWGRYGPKTILKRHDSYPIFAYKRAVKASLLSSIFRRHKLTKL
jgi:cell wall assembly regulator SMI1